MKNKLLLEALHYVLLFILISIGWTFAMEKTNDLTQTWLITFVIFVLGDLVLHYYLLGEK